MPVPFQLPRLYPILDTATLQSRGITPVQMADWLLNAGVQILQFRHKDPWTEHIYQQAKQVGELCRAANAAFILNDRADYAALLGAGVHVGQNDLPPLAVRRVVGDAPVGYSTHNRRQLTMGNELPVNYLALGPIYETKSKSNPDPVVGISGLGQLRSLTSKPLVAIGGITMHNAREVLAAGADSVASITGLLSAGATAEAVRCITQEWLAVVSY